ncbi:MAG TPA: zinc ribbon domain-containing protein [Candidatus Bathyarchaeia archaeon]|nr:zinc ribbon domain-containing protein [Candidatus Bathyarchaeia archaeon]
MFCDRCGAEVQPQQRFCGSCGKDFAAPVAPIYVGRVREHIRLVAVLWLVLSAMSAVAGLFLWILSHSLFPHLHEMGAPPDVPVEFLSSLFGMLAVAILLKSAAGFIAGWGLLRRELWARTLTIVLSFLALLNIPLGTALGIYSLWVFMAPASEAEYQRLVQTAGTA